MDVQTRDRDRAMHSQHARHGQLHPRMISRPPAPSVASYDNSGMGPLGSRTKSVPSSMPSRTPRYTIEPHMPSPIPKARINWKRLPAPILDLVLDRLRDLHLGTNSSSCTTCFMRDLCSVQMVCKAWFSDAQRVLYTHIEIVGQDDTSMLQKWRLSRAARLVRLRSTLRSRLLLAALVKTLHVPDPHMPLYLADGYPNPEYDTYLCILASVVMACPNLEALTGFIPFYNHTFDRLTHALSTRMKLRQHVWVIAENDDVRKRSQTQLPPGLLDDHQTYQFMLYHQRWKYLETLMLCSPGSLGVIEHELFLNVLHALPALKNLGVSSFDKDDFHDNTLLSLPSLTTLRLEECPGVTDAGLTRWATNPNAAQLERLTLLHQNVSSLLTLSKIFASLDRLKKFTIVQTDVVPSFPSEAGVVMFQPVLAAKSLEFVHWDILCDGEMGVPQTPNTHLALSILGGGFPSLTRLRAPRDTAPYGILQSVCQPKTDVTSKTNHNSLEARDVSRSNSLLLARFRCQMVSSRPISYGWGSNGSASSSHPRSSIHIDDPQATHQSNSEASTSTVSSWETIKSYASARSTNTSDTNPTTIASPAISEYEQGVSTGGQSDKEVVIRTRRTGPDTDRSSKRESICQCEPSVASNRDSICVCDVADGLNFEMVRTRDPLPSRSSMIRRKPVGSTRRPSANVAGAAGHSSREGGTSSAPTTRQPPRPMFYLEPDVPGREGNGGLVGWGELLQIKEKAKLNIGKEKKDGTSEKQAKRGDSDADDASSDEDGSEEEGAHDAEGMCTARWNNTPRRLSDMDRQRNDDTLFPLIKKILTSSSSLSSSSSSSLARDAPGMKKNLTSTSTSRLGLNLLRSSGKEKEKRKKDREEDGEGRWARRRHVARPCGSRGGSIAVEDFF